MDCLCRTCDQFIYDEYSINNPNLNDIDKIINNYVTSYNKKFNIYSIKCDFYLVFKMILKYISKLVMFLTKTT